MTKSINKKIFICMVFSVFVLCSFASHTSFAQSIITQGRDFLKEGENISNKINQAELADTSNYIIKYLTTAGIIVAVIVAMILGIQFMIASADEKAKVKESLMPFVVGCIVVFGAFTIWKVVVKIGNATEVSTSTTSKITCKNCNYELTGKLLEAALESGKCPKCLYGI